MTRQEQEEAEQAAYEEQMQALYDEQNWMQQMTEQVEQLQNEVLSERKRADSLRRACREQRVKNDVLRAELEVTQRARDHFRDAWAAAQVGLDCGVDATDAMREERAAVVAYLSECAQGGDTFGPRGSGDHLRLLATNIQRGWHRREEEEE